MALLAPTVIMLIFPTSFACLLIADSVLLNDRVVARLTRSSLLASCTMYSYPCCLFCFFPVPKFIDPVFTKTSPKHSFSLNRKRAFWLVFVKTGSIISGTGLHSMALVSAVAAVPTAVEFSSAIFFGLSSQKDSKKIMKTISAL
jgi:hypothetical protein